MLASKQKAPVTVGESDPEKRELEGVGWMRGNYHPFHTIWDNFRAPVAGLYHVRWLGYTIWVGPNGLSTATRTGLQDRPELLPELRDLAARTITPAASESSAGALGTTTSAPSVASAFFTDVRLPAR